MISDGSVVLCGRQIAERLSQWYSSNQNVNRQLQVCVLGINAKLHRPETNRSAKVKIKVMSIYIVPIHKTSLRCSGIAGIVKGYQSFTCSLHFTRRRNEPYLPLPPQPQLGLIYRPRRDGRLSRPWCKVALAEIRTYCLSRQCMFT